MRIEAYNQVAQLYNTTQVKPGNNVTKAKSMGRDEVQISSAGRDIQVAKAAVAEASDIREDKVAEIKARIEAGNYNVSSEEFASKLMEKYNSIF